MATHSYDFWEYETKEFDDYLEETIRNLDPIFRKYGLTRNQGILIYTQLHLKDSIEQLLELYANERPPNFELDGDS